MGKLDLLDGPRPSGSTASRQIDHSRLPVLRPPCSILPSALQASAATGDSPRLLRQNLRPVVHTYDEHEPVGIADCDEGFARVDDGAEILAKKPGESPVAALAWSADGRMLAWGTEDGEAGVIDLA